jgi:hypothetical protein
MAAALVAAAEGVLGRFPAVFIIRTACNPLPMATASYEI